jgi:hypothetical protein
MFEGAYPWRGTGLTVSDWVQIIVAVATAALAIVTALMAKRTADMAKATKDVAENTKAEAEAVQREAEAVLQQAQAASKQVDVTRAALQASIQPWLTPPPGGNVVGVESQRDGFTAYVILRNVGAGVALIPKQGCRIIGSPTLPQEKRERRGAPNASVIGVSDQTQILFIVKSAAGGPTLEEFSGQAEGKDGEFVIEIDYSDNQGQQRVTARLYIAGSPAGPSWPIYAIDYFRADEDEPFASVSLAS